MVRRPPPLLLATALLLVLGCGKPMLDVPRDVRVHVDRVAIDTNNVPVVVLEEEDGPRWLPIWIGSAEARSIALEMEELPSPRPNTHDLARSVIQNLEGEVVRVVVTDLKGGTYYALLTLRVRDKLVDIDSRPSDAIAIALRTRSPIFVREGLFDSVDIPAEDDPASDPEAEQSI